MPVSELSNTPLIEIMPRQRFIQTEFNLQRIGFFSAREDRKGVPPFKRTYPISVTTDGIRVQQIIELEGTRGLPGSADRDKWWAFLGIAERQRDARGMLNNPISFSGYEFLQELGVSDAGRNYDEILVWGERMTHTAITSRQVIYFTMSDTYADETVHVFARFKRLKEHRKTKKGVASRDMEARYEVHLADWLLANLNRDYTIPEDIIAYRKLVRPIAKTIFPMLPWWFASIKKPFFSKDYEELCLLLGIKCHDSLSQITRTLSPSLNELVEIDHASRWQIQRSVTGNGYNVVLWPGAGVMPSVKRMPQLKRLEISNGTRDIQDAAVLVQDEAVDAKEVVAEVAKLGITKKAAENLLKQFAPSRILDFAEYMTQRVATDTKRKIINPAGLLVCLLREGDEVPDGFITSRVRRRLEEEKANAQENRMLSQTQQVEYLTWREQQVENEVVLRYPGDAYSQKLTEVIAEHAKSDKQFATRTPHQRTNLAATLLRKGVRDKMSLPSFEMWCTTHSQYGLF
jgi:hypothetical protein